MSRACISSSRLPANVDEARRLTAAVEAVLQDRGLAFRPPPPIPSTCCGRGCNGCVWQGYYQALLCWRDDANELIGEVLRRG